MLFIKNKNGGGGKSRWIIQNKPPTKNQQSESKAFHFVVMHSDLSATLITLIVSVLDFCGFFSKVKRFSSVSKIPSANLFYVIIY